MPAPTKTPLRRTTTSPQSLQDSPFDGANTPTDSALNPPSVPANPSSGRNPANLSLQVPAIRAQDILAEGSIPDSIFSKTPPEIRVDEIPTRTPPLRVGQPLNSNSGKKPAININPSLPVPGTISSQSTTISIDQDSRPVLPPQHALLQPLPKVSFDLFNSS